MKQLRLLIHKNIKSSLFIYLLLLVISLLVYSSTYILAYARCDDTYLLRTWQHYKYFDIEQGRPLLWYAFNLSAQLYNHLGILSIQITRFIAAFLLPLYGLFQYKWLSRWEYNPIIAFSLTLAIISLPSCQIIIGNGPWLIFPLILVSIAANLFYYNAKSRKLNFLRNLTSIVLIIVSLAFYQSFSLLIFAMLIIPVIYSKHRDKLFNKEEWVLFSKAFLFTLLAIFIYYVIWLSAIKIMLPNNSSGYFPTQVLNTTISNIKLFYSLQLPQTLLLWFVYGNQKIGFISFITIAIGGFLLEICRSIRTENQISKWHINLLAIKRISLIFLLLISSNIFVFLVNNGVAIRYTTSLGLALSVLFIYLKLFLEVKWFAQKKPFIINTCNSFIILTTFITPILASISIMKYITLPSANEFNFVRQAISSANEFGDIDAIIRLPKHLNPKSKHPNPRLEFDWRFNSVHSGYTWYLIRLALLENKLDERRRITTFLLNESNNPEQKDMYDIDLWGLTPRSINHAGEVLTIDFNKLFDTEIYK